MVKKKSLNHTVLRNSMPPSLVRFPITLFAIKITDPRIQNSLEWPSQRYRYTDTIAHV